jgi:hypothetical protein
VIGRRHLAAKTREVAGAHLAMPGDMRSLALAIPLLVACTTSSPNPPNPPPPPNPAALQMNDLSVMFPLATTEADFDLYLAASSPGANGPLLPEALYQQDESSLLSYDNLRVVGMRLDPCFANIGPITDPSTCDNQIRLVFQQLDFEDDTTGAEDGGVHVLYSLTRDQLVAAANEIAAARQASSDADLGPLAVHPLIASQGLSGAFAQALVGIIQKYADGTKIERITTFSVDAFAEGGGPVPTNGIEMGGSGDGSGSGITLPEEGLSWDFHGNSVAASVETPLVIASLPDDTTDMFLDAATMPLGSTFSPVTTSTDNITTLADATNAGSASTAQRQAGFDSALRIENPNHESPNTIDCVSCHMAEPARVLVGQQMLGMSPASDANAFVADPSIPAADLAVTAPMLVGSDGGLNIHAFSYRETTPIINQRVINETAANVAYLNSL